MYVCTIAVHCELSWTEWPKSANRYPERAGPLEFQKVRNVAVNPE